MCTSSLSVRARGPFARRADPLGASGLSPAAYAWRHPNLVAWPDATTPRGSLRLTDLAPLPPQRRRACMTAVAEHFAESLKFRRGIQRRHRATRRRFGLDPPNREP